MQLFHSASRRGFFSPGLHGDLPADAVEITPQEHADLISAQSSGGEIVPGDDGVPVAILRPQPTPEDMLAAERATMVCSRFQARAALHLSGLLTQVEAVVMNADPLVQIAWSDAVEFRRNSPTIAALAAALALTDAQVDDLFRQASQITA